MGVRSLVVPIALVWLTAPAAAQRSMHVDLGSRVRVVHHCESRLARNGATYDACRFSAGTLSAVTADDVVLDPADDRADAVRVTFAMVQRVQVSGGKSRARPARLGALGLMLGAALGWVVGSVAEYTACGADCNGTVITLGTVLGGASGATLGVMAGRAQEVWVSVPLTEVQRLDTSRGAVEP